MPVLETNITVAQENAKTHACQKFGFDNKYSFYGYLLFVAVVFPIVVFSLPQFKDYANYIDQVDHSVLILGKFVLLILQGSPSILFSEPLWYSILELFSLAFQPPVILGIIVSLSITILSLSLSRINKKPWLTLALILVIYPLTIKYLFQFREGLAIALYMWGYTIKGRGGIILRMLTPFIHYGMFILVGVEVAHSVISRYRFSKGLATTFSIVTAIIITSAIPVLINLVSAQGFISNAYDLEAPSVSGLGVLLWGTYGTVLFLMNKLSKEIGLALIGISIFIFSQFYIDIGSRFLPIFIPFIIAALPRIDKKRLLFIYATFLIGLVLWVPTIMDPGRVFAG